MFTLTKMYFALGFVAGCAPLEEGPGPAAPLTPPAEGPAALSAQPTTNRPPAESGATASVQPGPPSRSPGPPTEVEALAHLSDAVAACGAEPQHAYVALSLRVKPTGDVASVDVVVSTVGSQGRIRCMKEHLQAVPFEAFVLPAAPKGSAVNCDDDSDAAMLGCMTLPHDAMTIGVSGVIAPSAQLLQLGAEAPTELPVELYTDDLRWGRDRGWPQACVAADAYRGWCFTLTTCSSANGYAGLTNPRGSAGGNACDPPPKDKPARMTLRQALPTVAPGEIVRRHRR